MLRRPFCGMAAGLLLGIAAAAYAGAWALFAVPVFWGITAGCTALCRRRRRGGSASGARLFFRFFLILQAFFLGWCRYRGEERFCEQYLSYLEDGSRILVQGKLDGKELRGQQYVYQLSSCVLGRRSDGSRREDMIRCGRILVYSDSDPGSIGEILVSDGRIEMWESAGNEGNFDAKSFYQARGAGFKLKEIQVKSRHGKKIPWREGLWKLRLRMREVYISAMGEETGSVLAAMVLGDKTLLDTEIKGLYQAAGLSHVLAISGLHISVIGMSVYGLLRRIRFGYSGSGAVAAGLMYAYAVMAGMSISVQRAFGMFLLVLLAQALGRGYDSLNALGVLASVMLCQNPFLPWDAGFCLSFAAVLGVVWVGSMDAKERRAWGKLRQALFSGTAIQLATLPLAAWYFYELPVYAVFVNLLVLPVMGGILACGIAGGIAGLLPLPLAPVFLFPCRKLLELNAIVCTACAGLPGAVQIVGRPDPVRMVLYYAGLAAAVWYRRRGKRRERRPAGKGYQYPLVCGLLLLFLFLPAQSGFELDVLDVGQGDASFLRTKAGFTVFVDGGSSDVSSAGTYRILPFLKAKGVRKIDYWFISHLDEDHISGLREILADGYRVRYLVFSQEIRQEEKLEELKSMAAHAGTEILYLRAGDLLHLGEAEIRVLFPADGLAGEDRNAGSMVFLYKEGDFSGIFTGDIGRIQERRLLEILKSGGIDAVDFYKAAHHGSDSSNSSEFLNMLRPAVSVISCSRMNRYGHPGREAVRHMEEAGSRVYLTMEGGRVRIAKKKGELIVEQYRKRDARF